MFIFRKIKRILEDARLIERLQIKRQRQKSLQNNIHFIFVWVPKNAGTSIFDHLEKDFGALKLKRYDVLRKQKKIEGPVTFGHVSMQSIRDAKLITDDYYQSAFKFAFVRNPYSRAVSLYNYDHRRKKIPLTMSFSTYLKMLKNDGVPPIGLYNSRSISLSNPQHVWLEEVDLDFIGRYETLLEDFKKIYDYLGHPFPAEHMTHKRNSKVKDHMEFYTPEDIACVNQIYAKDFELYDYEMMKE